MNDYFHLKTMQAMIKHKALIEIQINEVIPTVLIEEEAYRAEYTMNDVDKVCKDLKVRKASGWGRVDPEHWKYGGQIICQLLTVIVNCIYRIEFVPLHLKRGVIVPIDKPGKDSTYKGSNRCITIGPLIGKIWEKYLWYVLCHGQDNKRLLMSYRDVVTRDVQFAY